MKVVVPRPVRAAALALAGALAFASPALAADAPELRGGVAYTGVHRFDYNKDGNRNRVQFFLIFRARPAVGKKGEPGYLPEEGSLSYRVYDLDTGKQVDSWTNGFNMGFPSSDRPYPLTDIAIEGKTATFEGMGMKWTIVDGGEGWEKDTVETDDGVRKRAMRTYAGDLKVGTP
jgi:hypothetical protein